MTDSLHTHHAPDQSSSSHAGSETPFTPKSTTGTESSVAQPDSSKTLSQLSAETQAAILLARVHVLVQLSRTTDAFVALKRARLLAERFEDKLLISRCHFWDGVLLARTHGELHAVGSFLEANLVVPGSCPEARLLLRILQRFEPLIYKHFEMLGKDSEEVDDIMQAVGYEMRVILNKENRGTEDTPLTAGTVTRQLGWNSPFGGSSPGSNRWQPDKSSIDAHSDLSSPLDLLINDLLQQVQQPLYSGSNSDATADNEVPISSFHASTPLPAFPNNSPQSFVGFETFMSTEYVRKLQEEDTRRKERAEEANAKVALLKETPRDMGVLRTQNKMTPKSAVHRERVFPEGDMSILKAPKVKTETAGKPKDVVLSDTLAPEKVDSRIEVTTGRRKSMGENVDSAHSQVQNRRPLSLSHITPQRRMSTDPPSPSPLRKSSLPG